jgi:hypothetical protein
MAKWRNACRLLMGKPEGKRPLGRPRHRWVDNIRMDLGEAAWGDVDWIDLAQERDKRRALVNAVMNLFPSVDYATHEVITLVTTNSTMF